MIQSHEADGARSVTMDHAVQESCVLTGDALSALRRLLGGLQVFPDRMRANLELTNGLINAEAVMLALARTVGRQQAHHIVHDVAAHVATTPGARFADALRADPRVAQALHPDQLHQLLDPTTYLGHSVELARAAAHRARAASGPTQAPHVVPNA
jgi:3-carboxy-cis,cis-muconate cycloisomerase